MHTVLGYLWYRGANYAPKRLDSIPVRVNVNGIRGKSTVTRLITGVVQEAEYKTVGKQLVLQHE